jgi:arylsulfatase A-like enzyme
MRLIDDQIRRFVEFLQTEGLWQNTLLLFLSDHGDFAGEYGLVRKGPEMPEVLARVPMFFVGPGIAPRGAPHPAFVSIADVLPTICEAVGLPLPPGVQGRSLWPLLRGTDYPEEEFASVYAEQGIGGRHYGAEDNPRPENCLYGPGLEQRSYNELNTYVQSGTLRMLRTCDGRGDWKFLFDMQGQGQLYDLRQDPWELHNLYGQPGYADVERDLLARLLTWTLRVQDSLPYPPKPRIPLKEDPRNYWSPYSPPAPPRPDSE